MTTKATKAAAPAAPAAVEETLDEKLDRLRKEKELLELELALNMLRARAAQLPANKEF